MTQRFQRGKLNGGLNSSVQYFLKWYVGGGIDYLCVALDGKSNINGKVQQTAGLARDEMNENS